MDKPALPDALLPYQKAFIKLTDVQQVVLVEKSRRIGLTWGAAAEAVLTAGKSRSDGGMAVYYLGYNLEMTREFIDTCASWAQAFNQAASDVDELLLKDGDKDIKAFRISFASGLEIVALPSSPRVLRGRQGLVIIDEAAFHDDLKEVLKAALALLMWGGRVWIISTHDGDENPFNELCQDVKAGRMPYGHMRITFDDALADGLYQRICLRLGKPYSQAAEREWRADIIAQYGEAADEELHCIPSRGAGSFLPLALIERAAQPNRPVFRLERDASFSEVPNRSRNADIQDWCEHNVLPALEGLDKKALWFFGEDFARSGDLTVIWPLALTQGMKRDCPFVVEMKNIPFEQQKLVLFYIVDRLPRFVAGALDATGNGAWLAEKAADQYGHHRIEQIKLSDKFYEEHMPRFKAGFEDDLVAFPRDRDLVQDHRAIKVMRGIAKVPRGENSGTGGSKRHGDAAIASFLGYYASTLEVKQYGYHPARMEGRNAPFGELAGSVGGKSGFGKGAWG